MLAYVDMLANPIELYNRVTDDARRVLLVPMFTQLVVHVEGDGDGDGINIDSERTEVNSALRQWNAQRRLAQTPTTPETTKRAPGKSVRGSLSTSEEVLLSKS